MNIDGIDVYATYGTPTLVDFMLREELEGDWETVLLSYGFLQEDEEQNLVPVFGVNLDVIGPIVIAPAVLGEDGETVVVPAVMDNRTHINMRVMTSLDWQPFALDWVTKGAMADPNSNEACVTYEGLTMIDPNSLSSPSRVWA